MHPRLLQTIVEYLNKTTRCAVEKLFFQSLNFSIFLFLCIWLDFSRSMKNICTFVFQSNTLKHTVWGSLP